MWIRCTYGTKNCIIACIYHPPKPRYNTEVFVRELSADLENMLYTSGDSIFVLAGDFNSLIFDEWQEVWNCCGGNKLHAIRPNVGYHKQKTCLSRRDSVLLSIVYARCRALF